MFPAPSGARRRAAVLAALLFALAAPAAHAYSFPVNPITVSGNRLLRDGVPWIPRGIQIVGLVAPKGRLKGKYIAAAAHFGASELETAVIDHADVARFQVSEFGLDPDDPLYSPAYVKQVETGVELARAVGLNVIVSIQAQAPAGALDGCPMPDAGTEQAWSELAPMFKADPGVMFELYNEPSLGATSANWLTWEWGGPTDQAGDGCQAVGMQTLIDEIRADGADNVIIVPGLGGETTLEGMPQLLDPADLGDPQLAYGIHYPSLVGSSALWDRKFGQLSASVPVIVTEWYANSIRNCAGDQPGRAALLLDYLQSKQIGVVGFAFDIPGTIVANWSYAPTTYANFACGSPGDGAGELLFERFRGLAAADAPTGSDDSPAWIFSYQELQFLHFLAPALVRRSFDTSRTFVTGASASQLIALGLSAAVPTAVFENEVRLARAAYEGALPPGTRAVLYEDQDWSLTPRAQQRDPALYYGLAARAAHHRGLLLIAAPSPDLIAALSPRTRKARTYDEFLSLDLAGAAAADADVFEIQAQSSETDRSEYAPFVRAVAEQAAEAHAAIAVLSSISTNPAGAAEPAATLVRAALSARAFVTGFAVADPTAGKTCPTCTGPYPDVVKRVLRGLRAEGT